MCVAFLPSCSPRVHQLTSRRSLILCPPTPPMVVKGIHTVLMGKISHNNLVKIWPLVSQAQSHLIPRCSSSSVEPVSHRLGLFIDI